MKIAIATVQVPFIKGGAEILTEMLKQELIKRGHSTEIVTIPFKWYPSETLETSMMMGRMMDLSEVNGEKIDKVIAMKFPAIYTKHKNKVIWLMHQHRQAYDLWGTEYGDMHTFPDGERMRQLITECDKKYINESDKVFTIAKNTSDRLKKFCNIESEVLYHPPLNSEKLYCENYEDFIFYPSRIDPIKRQRVLVEAARHIKSPVKIVLAGNGSNAEIEYLQDLIKKYHLQNIVVLKGFISEEEKIQLYANCLGVYFGAYDEDYGYITLESFFAKKPVIVHDDAGGPLEFVVDGENGFVIECDSKKLAQKIDYFYSHRDSAKKMGEAGYKMLIDKHMNWDYVIEKLLK